MFGKRKVTLADVLTDIKIARNRVRIYKNRMKDRILKYNQMAERNFGRFTSISAEYMKEVDQLQRVVQFLDTLDILLEMAEIKIETIVYIGYIVNEAPAVIEALKELKKQMGGIPELSVMLEDIYSGFYASVEVPQEMKIRSTEEGKKVLEEAEKISESREEKLLS
ncbi:cell division protein CdvB3 [Sulfuracidifex tepidarius]|uniref:Cell division protein B2 n=1 Tax=Sulfuracidifex tepidarius TaxID=1294262 RepID=A0A510DV37_9CREN|nr:cell division protein CdvB3 [Sulfuracidifex tepidarius]BBG24039.1 Cell division protein B2 [Sulfuracidifex tepidarius]BBG26794.1 Cell division protein B2 [Sulfuracidifex tepidarius]